jgi:hypothetical protein
MSNENELNRDVCEVKCQAARRSWRSRLVTAGLNLLAGLAVSLVALGLGAITLDWTVSTASAYLNVGLWLLISGIVLCLIYLIVYTIFGE